MAKQTFTTGSVLTAAQMTSLQQTAMLGGAASAKVANYVLVAADAGTAISMSNAGATTITVNAGLFAAGDTVTILNVGAGTCTITAGTATVSKPTNATLALVTNAGGVLYFTATGAATFMPFDVGAAAATSSKNFSLLNTGGTTLTGATTVTYSGISGMDQLFIMIDGASSVNIGASVSLRINTDTGGNYDSYYVQWKANASYAANNFDATSSLSNTWLPLAVLGSSAASGAWGYVSISGCNTAGKKMITFTNAGDTNTNQNWGLFGGGVWNNTATVTSVSLVSSSGNFDAGKFYVYGSA